MTRLALLLMLAVSPAAAQTDVTRQPRWSAGTTDTAGGLSRTTSLAFERTAHDRWTVSVRCEVRDPRTGKWRAATAEGTAVRVKGVILGTAGELGRWVLGDGGIAFPDRGPCASGNADVGTGD